MGTVDKFGRHSISKILSSRNGRQQQQQGPRGLGFELTENGDFNIAQRRLTDVQSPVDLNDACTKKYVDEINKNNLQLNNDIACFDAKRRRIVNIKNPENDYDVCNINFIKRYCLNICHDDDQQTSCFDGGFKRIVNLSEPINGSDAVTKKYLQDTCMNPLQNKITLMNNIGIPNMINSKLNSLESGLKSIIMSEGEKFQSDLTEIENSVGRLKDAVNEIKNQYSFLIKSIPPQNKRILLISDDGKV